MKGSVLRKEVLGGVGVVKLERVLVICPACRQQVEAVARDGRVRGYCTVASQYVDFLAEKQRVGTGEHPTTETKAEIATARTQVREGRDTSGRFIKGNVPWNKRGVKS